MVRQKDGDVENLAQSEKTAPRRKEIIRLSYGIGSDEIAEETLIYNSLRRSNNLDIFYQDNPEHVLVEKETRQEEITNATAIYDKLYSCLTERQRDIIRFRMEGYSFNEIAQLLNEDSTYTYSVSVRTVFDDWKKIRETAHQVFNGHPYKR